MGGLPLALDQAGAYLEATRCGLPAYLELFRTQRAALLQERGEGTREHPASVWATFTLALAATAARRLAVGDLLCVCALLQAEAIPEELFRQGAAQLGAALEALCRDGLAWNQVVARACAYSLVSRHPEEQTLSLHRLVQAILVDTMTQAERAAWSRRIIAALDAVFPEVWYSDWKQGERLVQHALLCLHAAEDSLVVASLALKVALYLRARGQYTEVKSLTQRALQIREQLLGPEHLDVADALSALAVLCVEQGQYEEATPLYLRALRIQEQGMDPTDSQMVWTLNSLAQLSWTLGNYGEAEALYQRALHSVEQALTLDRYLKAELLNNLAYLYCDQGRGREAEALYQQALGFWRQKPHPHASTPTDPQSGLAPLVEEPGRAGEADAHDPYAWALREQWLRPDPPEVAYSLNGLAELCREQGRAGEAEALYQRALSLWEQQLGEMHPGMAYMLTGLASLYREQGREAEAEPLYYRALALREQALGAAHPKVAETLHELARFRRQQERLHEARSLADRALSIRSQALGEAHPQTRATRDLYAQLLQAPVADAPGKASNENAGAHQDRCKAEPSVERASLSRHEAGDHVQGFLRTCCELNPRAWCRVSDLWQAYEHWSATEQRCIPLSRRSFAAHLKAQGCRADHTSTARIWRGVRLVQRGP
jgi:tetratricopeptide (TPR) repeat protein